MSPTAASRFSRTSRAAPTGTSTARSASVDVCVARRRADAACEEFARRAVERALVVFDAVAERALVVLRAAAERALVVLRAEVERVLVVLRALVELRRDRPVAFWPEFS